MDRIRLSKSIKVGDVLITRKSLGVWLRKRSLSQCPSPMEKCIWEVKGCHLPISTAVMVWSPCSAFRRLRCIILIPTFLPVDKPQKPFS